MENRVEEKTKTYPWHYLHNAAHHAKQLPAESREPFMKLTQDLCKVFTVSFNIDNSIFQHREMG